jgi:hypothetical protein
MSRLLRRLQEQGETAIATEYLEASIQAYRVMIAVAGVEAAAKLRIKSRVAQSAGVGRAA